MPDLDRLTAAARAILPDGVAVAAADPGQLYPLFPGETLLGAVPARLREFSAGRHAARMALADLGRPVTPIPQADDRAPIWPEGLSGSITHSQSACLAAVSLQHGIGLDLEEETPLAQDLWSSILLPPEEEWVWAEPDPGLAAKLIFSAKEAAYKAQYPLSRTLFGFETLLVQVTGTGFTASFQRDIGPFALGSRLAGKVARAEDHILTAVMLQAV